VITDGQCRLVISWSVLRVLVFFTFVSFRKSRVSKGQPYMVSDRSASIHLDVESAYWWLYRSK